MMADSTEPNFENDYNIIRNYTAGSDVYLPLLSEEGKQFSDITLRFSEKGQSHQLHQIMLCSRIGNKDAPLNFEELATQFPLDESLEPFVIDMIYRRPLPPKLSIGLTEVLKLFVRCLSFIYFTTNRQCTQIWRFNAVHHR